MKILSYGSAKFRNFLLEFSSRGFRGVLPPPQEFKVGISWQRVIYRTFSVLHNGFFGFVLGRILRELRGREQPKVEAKNGQKKGQKSFPLSVRKSVTCRNRKLTKGDSNGTTNYYWNMKKLVSGAYGFLWNQPEIMSRKRKRIIIIIIITRILFGLRTKK